VVIRGGADSLESALADNAILERIAPSASG
jgi:hypothetical protein